jgi:excisionase family DNA binding protein
MKESAYETTPDGLHVITASRAALWARVSALDWLTADEASLYLRVSGTLFEECVSKGPIPFSRPGGRDRRFFRKDLDAFLHSRRENQPEQELIPAKRGE